MGYYKKYYFDLINKNFLSSLSDKHIFAVQLETYRKYSSLFKEDNEKVSADGDADTYYNETNFFGFGRSNSNGDLYYTMHSSFSDKYCSGRVCDSRFVIENYEIDNANLLTPSWQEDCEAVGVDHYLRNYVWWIDMQQIFFIPAKFYLIAFYASSLFKKTINVSLENFDIDDMFDHEVLIFSRYDHPIDFISNFSKIERFSNTFPIAYEEVGCVEHYNFYYDLFFSLISEFCLDAKYELNYEFDDIFLSFNKDTISSALDSYLEVGKSSLLNFEISDTTHRKIELILFILDILLLYRERNPELIEWPPPVDVSSMDFFNSEVKKSNSVDHENVISIDFKCGSLASGEIDSTENPFS